MDIIAHAVYGATFFSRKGLAGGRNRVNPSRYGWFSDLTVWMAALFGILPDVISMWPAFAMHVWSGSPGNFFAHVDTTTLIVYRYTHSLVIALPCCALLGMIKKSWFLPTLAWPLHIIMDATTHGMGKFQTRPLHPLSDFTVPGINWWEYPSVFIGYWAALPIIWIGLWVWRRSATNNP